MGVGEIIAVLETVAPDRERHTPSPSCLPTKLRWPRSCSAGFAVRAICLLVLLKERRQIVIEQIADAGELDIRRWILGQYLGVERIMTLFRKHGRDAVTPEFFHRG